MLASNPLYKAWEPAGEAMVQLAFCRLMYNKTTIKFKQLLKQLLIFS